MGGTPQYTDDKLTNESDEFNFVNIIFGNIPDVVISNDNTSDKSDGQSGEVTKGELMHGDSARKDHVYGRYSVEPTKQTDLVVRDTNEAGGFKTVRKATDSDKKFPKVK